MGKLNVTQLQAEMRNVQARWKAADIQEIPHLGYSPGPTNRPLVGVGSREEGARENYSHFQAFSAMMIAAPHPTSVDWRDYKGNAFSHGNYVSEIRDQKNCGSCVAFGTLAAFEAAMCIKAKNPDHFIDLSEADLFYCHEGVSPGPSCNTGWYPEAALTSCQNSGVVEEACFPYKAGDQPCKNNAAWHKNKIIRWHKIKSATDMKHLLANHGPLITCMSVYEDFFHYQSGVYHHISGTLQGGHCICCVGYDDTNRSWVCKNSWGPGWGDKGFFRIAYGQCGIDASMWTLQF